MPGQATPRPSGHDLKAARIAALSEEFLIAAPKRRHEIGEEIAGLMSGRILPIRSANHHGSTASKRRSATGPELLS